MLDFRHKDTARLYDYWRSLADGNPPNYRLWDPIDIPQLMPFVTIFELNSDDEFVHRFAGTGVCDFVGVELTGLLLRDLFPSPEAYAIPEQNMRTMLAMPCGRLGAHVVRAASGQECLTEMLTLPLSRVDGASDRLIVYMAILETHGFGKATPEVAQYVEADWIDLGFGVPEMLSAGVLAS